MTAKSTGNYEPSDFVEGKRYHVEYTVHKPNLTIEVKLLENARFLGTLFNRVDTQMGFEDHTGTQVWIDPQDIRKKGDVSE